MSQQPLIAVLMGSDSDWSVMREAAKVLQEFQVPFEVMVTSAHRTPERTYDYAALVADRGIQLVIVGAGAAAHLGGVVAAVTPLPVIAVPLEATSLAGLDALLSTVQMPGSVPVATMAIGKAGARNAALFAIRILALSDASLRGRMIEFRHNMALSVEEKDRALQVTVAAEFDQAAVTLAV
ncbi:MAG: 5-(carboxyamino)imidazole ribonucleotide mutase [Magnetococcales bacterium]|nr:5-(carboxyamino)imidazole ribonucleotide mutase [Magnetococcales bacterium]